MPSLIGLTGSTSSIPAGVIPCTHFSHLELDTDFGCLETDSHRELPALGRAYLSKPSPAFVALPKLVALGEKRTRVEMPSQESDAALNTPEAHPLGGSFDRRDSLDSDYQVVPHTFCKTLTYNRKGDL